MHNPVQTLCLVSVCKGQCLCLRCDYVACDTYCVYFLYFQYACEEVSYACICTALGVLGYSGGQEVQEEAV